MSEPLTWPPKAPHSSVATLQSFRNFRKREVSFMAPRKALAMAAVAALSAASLAACGGGNDNSGGSIGSGPVTMQFWHNATTGPGKAFWDKTVADFQTSHPNVKIQIQAI